MEANWVSKNVSKVNSLNVHNNLRGQQYLYYFTTFKLLREQYSKGYWVTKLKKDIRHK